MVGMDADRAVNARPRQQVVTLANAGDVVLTLAIFALGATFRLADLGLMRISYDNSYSIYEVLRGLAGGGWPTMGQAASVFLPNPPLMVYIQALPFLVWRSPWAVCFFIVTLNSLATLCVFWAARKLLGRGAGYIAAMLFAINPWAVYYSREAWMSSLMPLFVTSIAAALWPALTKAHRPSTGLLIAALAITAMTQTYIQSWGLLISIGLLLLLFRSALPRRPILIGTGIIALGFIVYGVNVLSVWNSAGNDLGKFTSGELHLTAEGINHAVRFVTGMDYHAQYPELVLGSNLLSELSQLVYIVLSIALLIGIALAVRAIWQKRPERRIGVILLLWFLVPVALMTITSHPVHPYYLLLSVPAGHLLAAWGFMLLAQRPAGRVMVGAVLCGCAIVFGLNVHWFNVNAALHPTGARFEDWTLESGVQMGRVVNELTAYDPVSPRVVADARPSLIGSLSSKYVRLISGVVYPGYVVLPGSEPVLYVLMNESQAPSMLGPHAETFADKDMQFVDGTRVSFVRVMPYTRSAALALPATSIDWPSAAGLTLLGYTLNHPIAPGGDLDLITYWRVDELRHGYDQWFVGAFYQLFDQSGRQIASADGHGQYARRWQLGDVYVEHTRIAVAANLAAGEYALKLGLFDSIHSQAYPFVSTNGPQDTLNITVKIAGAQ